MSALRAIALAALLTVPAYASAQVTPAQQPAPTVVESTTTLTPYVMRPFSGTYQVFRGEKPLGQATMRLVNTGGGRWRIDLNIIGTQGLAGAAGVNIQQSTVFDEAGDEYRPLSQSTVRHALFATRKTVGVYNWNTKQAAWSGDVKKSRRGRVIPLQAGDMSGLLINLAVMRDADERFSASVMISSSIRLSLAGFEVGWMIYMSSPRTFSKTSTKIS